MPAADVSLRTEGTVVQASPNDNFVKVLVEYGRYRERRLCTFPRALWDSQPPEEGQRCTIEFSRDEVPPRIWVSSPRPSREQIGRAAAIQDVQELLGIKPEDKAMIVLGGEYENVTGTDHRHYLGWGEGLALRLVPSLLFSIGVRPENIDYVFPEEVTNESLHAQYPHRHVIFLGSARSNEVLRETFWPHMRLRDVFDIPDNPLRLQMHLPDKTLQWLYEDFTSGKDVPRNSIHVHDPFFVAVTANPHDPTGYFRCILSCGAGTFGTAYGAVVLTARETVERIADAVRPDKMERPEWETVWRVDMDGLFNRLSDPVECLYGLPNPPITVLTHSITARQIWSPDPSPAEEESALSEVLERCLRDER